MKKLLLGFFLCATAAVAQVLPPAPARTLLSFDERNLATLQKRFHKGTANPMPWSGYWWPYKSYGIAQRMDYSGLSPAEKLDRAQGYSNWIATWEYYNHGTAQAIVDWWGHCNGWATAALMEEEPREERVVNGVRFGVGDRKAALAEYWLESGLDFIGTRVDDRNDFSSDAFWDVIPAHFHLLITNIIGRQRRAVILDRHTGAEIWNHPMLGYEIRPIHPKDYLGPNPEYPNIYRVNVTTTIWWADDNISADAVTPKFDWMESEFFASRTLKYELWVDAPLEFDSNGELVRSGNIIVTDRGYGGQWKNGFDQEALANSHPDFIWIPLSYTRSTGYKNPRLNDDWVRANLAN